jgi:hypothetical protein
MFWKKNSIKEFYEIQKQLIQPLLFIVLDYSDFEVTQLFLDYKRPLSFINEDLENNQQNLLKKFSKWKTGWNHLSFQDYLTTTKFKKSFHTCSCYDFTSPQAVSSWALCIARGGNIHNPIIKNFEKSRNNSMNYLLVILCSLIIYFLLSILFPQNFSVNKSILPIIIIALMFAFEISMFFDLWMVNKETYHEDLFLQPIIQDIKPIIERHNLLLKRKSDTL